MKTTLTKNLVLKVLAFMCAALLWLVVVNIDDPIKNKTFTGIEVHVTNESIITNSGKTYRFVEDTDKINVTVKAKQSVLQKIKTDDIIVEIDMKELNIIKSQLSPRVRIPAYEGSYEEVYTTPTNVQVKLEDDANVRKPITPEPIGNVRDGYVVGELKVNPETVLLGGAQSTLDQIDKVAAQVNVTGFSKTKTEKTSLIFYDKEGKIIQNLQLKDNLGDDGVSVEVVIHKVKSVPVVCDTSQVQPADGYDLGEVTYEPKELRVSGEDSVLESVDSIEIPASELVIDNLSERKERIVDVTSYLPEGLKLVDQNAGNVVVTVNAVERGVKTETLLVGSIAVINPPKGLALKYDDEEITLRITGNAKALESLHLTSDNIHINLLDYQTAGKYKTELQVDLPEGCKLAEKVTVGFELVKE